MTRFSWVSLKPKLNAQISKPHFKTNSAIHGEVAPVLICPARSWRFSKQIRGGDTKMKISLPDANADLQG